MPVTIRTLGHGAQTADAFVALVTGAAVGHVVDVRSYPGSRRHPHFGRPDLEEWLPAAGVTYSWERRLGGRRKPSPDSRHAGLTHEGFRAYADHMQSAEFAAGLAEVLDLTAGRADGGVAAMCAESVWWQCHRRLLADALVLLHGVTVEHLMPDGRLAPHRPTEAARVEGGGLVYDVGETGRLL
ncbi:MAG: DUF488 family protein [Acidimicrobiia bacterium]